MARQATDQLYIELDYYYPEEYLVYIALGQVDLAPWIEDEYLEVGYYEYYGGSATLTCDLTEVLNIEAEAAISTSAALTADIGKIQQGASTMSAEFSQSATISHIEGADLFAFSDAQIAALVDRIRDYNISTSTAFDIASDYIRIRLADSAESAEFSISSSGERSRSFASALEAAFSFASTENRLRDVTSNLNTEVSIALDASRTRDLASTISSDFASSATATRIQELAANISSEATVACVISHIEGADLVAFSNANVNVTADVTRTTEINIQSQTSIALSANRTRDNQSNHIVSITQNTDVDRIRDVGSDQTLAFTCSALVLNVKQLSCTLNSEIAVSCVISHIEGADLVAFSNAALTAQLVRVRISSVSLANTSTVTANVDKRKGITLTNLAASASVIAVPRKGYTYRPLSVVVQNGPANQRIVTSDQSKFGSKSLYIESSGSFGNRPYIRYADSSRLDGIGGRSYAFFDLWIRLETNDASIFKVWNPTAGSTSYGLLHTSGGLYYRFTNPGSGTFNIKISNALSLNTWHHIAVRADFTSGGGSWINGSRTSNTSLPIYYTASTHLEIGDSQLGSGDSTQRFYIDEFRILVGTDSQLNALGFNAETNATITVPTARYYDSDTSITQFLAHYDIDYRDDVGALLNADASISSSASLIANAIRPVEYASALSSEFQQTANGDRLRGIDSLLANQTTVSAQPVAVFDANVNISSQANSQTSLGIIKEFACALSNAATVSCVISHIHGADLVAFSDAAVFAQASIIRNTNSSITSAFNQSVVNDRLRQYNSIQQSAFSLDGTPPGETIRNASSSLVVESLNFYTDPINLRGFASAITSQATVSTQISKITGFASTMAAVSTQAAYVTRILQLEANIASEGSQLTVAIKVGRAVVDCALVLTATIDAAKSVAAAANITSNFAVNAIPVNIYTVPAYLTAASSLSIELGIVKEYAANYNASATVLANGTASADVVANVSSAFNQVSVFDLTRGATSNQSAAFNTSIDYTRKRFADVYIDAALTQSTQANATFDHAIAASTAFALACTISHIEGADLVAFSNAALTIDAFVGKTGEANVSANANISADLLRIRSTNGNVVSAFSTNQNVNYIANNAANAASVFTSNVNGSLVAGAFSNIQTEASVNCTISHIEGANLVAFSNAAVTTNVNRIRDNVSTITASAAISLTATKVKLLSSSLQTNASIVCDATKVIIAAANITANSNIIAQVNATLGFSISITDAMTFTAGVREIDFDSVLQEVYKIPREIWTYRISSETRLYSIAEETRIYKVRSTT